LKMLVFVHKIRDIYPYEDMIVLIVFERYTVSHQ